MEVVKENQQLHMVGLVCFNTVTPNHNMHVQIFLPCLYTLLFYQLGEFVSLKRLLIS